MVVTPSRAGAHHTLPPEVVWHDLECGAYRADLPLWRELAEEARLADPAARILDIGAGSGRVALELARAGHHVTALDSAGALLEALRLRASGTPVETVEADARSFELPHRDYALCLVPMQTVQLLGGPAGRREMLRAVRAHLRPGGLLACAIVTELEPFDAELEGHRPSPERAHIEAALYESRALSVRVGRRSIRIERERTATPDSGGQAPAPTRERNVIELDRLSAARLHREGGEAGLHDAGTRSVSSTEEHVGSTVVMLRG